MTVWLFRNGSRIVSDIIADSVLTAIKSSDIIGDSLPVSRRQSDGGGGGYREREDIGGGSVIRARVKCTAALAGGN